MKKRSAWFAAWFAVLIIGVVAMMAVAPMGKAAEQKQFIVGFDAEFPPYGYMDDNGEYVGFDLDLAAEVCKRNGWKLVKRPIAWDSKDSELATGAISCIWNGFTMNGREDNYTWSTAYVDNSQVVIVKKDSNVHKLSDLKGKRLIVQSDSSALAALTGDDATKENKKLAPEGVSGFIERFTAGSRLQFCIYESGKRYGGCDCDGYRRCFLSDVR